MLLPPFYPLAGGGQPLYRLAGEVPSFDINPGELGHVRDLLSGLVLGGGSVNCATPAWEVGPDGILFQPAANTPVVGYDPVTLRPVGLRAWGVVTNLLTHSNNPSSWGLQQSGLGSSPVVTPNYAISPNGTMNASRVIFALNGGTSTADFSGLTSNSTTRTINTIYTGSVWIKSNTSETYNVRLDTRSAIGGTVQATPTRWTRVSQSNVDTSGTNGTTILRLRGNQGTSDYADVLVYGLQLNTGPLAPYVPTTTTAASSTADAIDIASLAGGINNIRTIYARVRTPASGIRGIISLNDNSSSNRLELLTNGTDPRAVAVTSDSTVADINGGTIAANTTFRIAARFDGDNYAVSINGAPVVTDNAGARAIVDRIFLGRTQAGEYLNGYIERLATWTQPLSDARLKAIAS